SPGEIHEAIRLAKTSDRPIFILLDTVDLLLRDELHRDALLTFIGQAFSQGVTIIATCRPREFESMGIAAGETSNAEETAIGFKRFDLGAYDETEFQEA